MAKPIERSELKYGARLLRQVPKAIPPEEDDRQGAVLREAVKGMANAAKLAAKEDALREPRSTD